MDRSNERFIVHFNNIQVNVLNSNSGIFVGTNRQYGWSCHSKSNGNVRGISGDGNTFASNIHVVYDDDLIDTPIDDRDLFLSGAAAAAKDKAS